MKNMKKRDKILLIVALVIGNIMAYVVTVATDNGYVFLSVLIISLLLLTFIIINNDKDEPEKEDTDEESEAVQRYKLKSLYKDLFEATGFVSHLDIAPEFLNREVPNMYYMVDTFKSMIPLSEWLKRKDQIENIVGAKITKIETYSNDPTIIYMYIKINDLSEDEPWRDKFLSENENELVVGKSCDRDISIDLNNTAHGFIAGETGSGKTTMIKGMIYQALIKNHGVIIIDFKRGVSYSLFDDYVKIYSEYEEIAEILENMCEVTKNRLDVFRANKVENIKEYNNLKGGKKYRRLIVFIDELAELVKTSDKNISKRVVLALESLTRISRAAGIHLIMGMQRPDSTVINGQIKNNVALRICGLVPDPVTSRIMLDNDMASDMPKITGRFIIRDNRGYTEFQGYNFTKKNMTLLEYSGISEITENVQNVRAEPKQEITTPKKEVKPKEPETVDFNFDDVEL
jgi:DNA segregation ATPase FtsK/SpoIIIE and related proteins